jgi:hypothetical protein
MTTIVRALVEDERPHPEPRQDETTFICVNPDHHLLAQRRERMRLRDHRFIAPPGGIPSHDYCGAQEQRGPVSFAGRPAFCPLGAGDEDHEWQETAWSNSSRP